MTLNYILTRKRRKAYHIASFHLNSDICLRLLYGVLSQQSLSDFWPALPPGDVLLISVHMMQARTLPRSTHLVDEREVGHPGETRG